MRWVNGDTGEIVDDVRAEQVNRDFGLLRLRVWERMSRQELREKWITRALWCAGAVVVILAVWEIVSW